MHQNQNKNQKHVPVLLAEVLEQLDPQEGESYLDLTAGYGGHAQAILAKTKADALGMLVDRDQSAIDAITKLFKGRKLNILKQDFLAASQQLVEERRKFDLILVDLGVSSPHLKEVNRGFAFAATGPLDMRMDQSQALTAEKVVNNYSEAEVANILTRFGEEPKARQIARSIIANRPIMTTTQLAAVVARAWPGYSRVHPATRSFQALRIVVNDELRQLRESLPLWIKLLAPAGRIGVISFHSLEDRIVKHYFAELGGTGYDAVLRILTKRPILSQTPELVINPRARSAKLRVAVKIKTEREA
ncbi:MAG TPA: 16S rRNA (cytosine(1402)-N(4))-methyltransferase RsmH [Candidatus Dormibacteraeota bacterium]|nr:16S rRNA (cytosine(1402)-N(4))-methyltransferase RsmH [Candidatus Dormibacteraeota bacterium]